MYARFGALCCLATVLWFPAVAADAPVEVVLRNTGGVTDHTLTEMRFELDSLMERAGFTIEWNSDQGPATAFHGDLVVVELRGTCKPPSTSIPISGILQLGSSAVADGKVLPFSWVDCSALAQFLEPHLTREQRERPEPVYGRALARVLAHELYHVLGRTLAHTASGLTKASVEPSDLLDEQANFENVATARLQAVNVSR